MKVLIGFIFSMVVVNTASGETLHCEAPLGSFINGHFIDTGILSLDIPKVDGLLAQTAHVQAYDTDYGSIPLNTSSMSFIDIVTPNADFLYLAFTLGEHIQSPGIFGGVVDVVFIGPKRPIGKSIVSKPDEEFFESQITCQFK